MVKEIRREDGLLLCRPSELFTVQGLALGQARVPGDYAEVGVYKGATAKLMCEAKGEKHIHLFDTFEGLPNADTIDIRFRTSMFSAQEEAVRRRLAQYQNGTSIEVCFRLRQSLFRPSNSRSCTLTLTFTKARKTA